MINSDNGEKKKKRKTRKGKRKEKRLKKIAVHFCQCQLTAKLQYQHSRKKDGIKEIVCLPHYLSCMKKYVQYEQILILFLKGTA